MLDLARRAHPDIEAVFVNSGLEFPQIVKFVKTFENVEILKPSMSYKQVIEKYGYPVISKEQANYIHRYELDYKQHVDEVERVRADFHVGEVYVVFNSNEKHAFGADEFNKNRMAIADRYGSIKDTHYFCSDEPKLCATLQETRTEREQNAQPCTIDEYMKEEFSSEDELEP